uniref:Uncharacterized protein n=1 Tax=Phaeodactylum tricornutum TaxID=2850 RepID=A0A8J9X490_PHATR
MPKLCVVSHSSSFTMATPCYSFHVSHRIMNRSFNLLGMLLLCGRVRSILMLKPTQSYRQHSGSATTTLPPISRRQVLQRIAIATTVSCTVLLCPFQRAVAAEMNVGAPVPVFRATAVGRSEYTNSITASRDTNISPQEAYDVILQQIPKARTATGTTQVQSPPIALDLGAGAGLSTAVLYQDLGYRRIDAVDWSADAWDANVVAPVPESVKFYQASDQAFFDRLDEGRRQQPERKPTSQDANEPSLQTRRDAYSYDVIVYNFAVNPQKAIKVAKQRLKPDGLLLAPVNDKADYWYKQSYWVVDASGTVVWTSRPEVGAWSVQFQPDVTSDTCTGICGSFNGFAARR